MPKQRNRPVLGDHPDTLGIIHRAMISAARKARDESDRLGIPAPGNEGGKVVWKQPPAKKRRSAKTKRGPAAVD